jgi:hypothetical protein
MVSSELAALVEANAWTYGPNATALRILQMTLRQKLDPASFWEELLAESPRMAPLGYWLASVRGGRPMEGLEEDLLQREQIMINNLLKLMRDAPHVLIVGHDREIDQLWEVDPEERSYRYLLLEGPAGVEPPGGRTVRRYRPGPARIESPFGFERLEESLDWADVVLLSGFIMHRQNLLGPAQLRPFLSSVREQTELVLLCTTNERRLTLGDGAPRQYREDFRPYFWQSSITHLVSEWHRGAENRALGWLPLPPEILQDRFGEALFPT